VTTGYISIGSDSAGRRRVNVAPPGAGVAREITVVLLSDAAGDGEAEIAGIDVHSAAVLRVVQTCLPASHGGLTAAKVREAIANAGR
jgi:hypothetical protein